MIDPPSSPRGGKVKEALNKWQVTFLVFAIAYLVVLLLNLTNMPMQWDEVTHLNGALTLNAGHFGNYVSNAFYPPLFDLATAVSFQAFGASLFSARLVSAVFSVLSLWAVFELTYSMYNGKTALLAAVLLGIMPGYFWLSRLALLETMLLFFVTLALLFFFRWLQNKQDKYLVFSGLAVGLGFLTKYQAVVAGVIMVASLAVFGSWAIEAGVLTVYTCYCYGCASGCSMDSHSLPSVRIKNLQPMALRPASWQPRKISLQRPLPFTNLLPNRHSLALQQLPSHLHLHLRFGFGGFGLSRMAPQ